MMDKAREIEAAKELARLEWPLASPEEQQRWVKRHWQKYLPQARAALAAAGRVAGDDVLQLALNCLRRIERDLTGTLLHNMRADAKQTADAIAAALAAAGDRTAVHDDQREPESKALDELCAACGEPRREHVTPGGTRYGPTTLCGVFIPRDPVSPGKGEGWREIRSAPKDETPIQLGRAGHIPMTGYCGPHREEWWLPGTGGNVPFEPTHWQPLPSPPRASA